MPSPARTAALLALAAVTAGEAFDRWVRRTGRAASDPAGRPVAVVVLGFPGHRSWARAIQRWRVEMGARALARHPGSTLFLTGGRTRGPVSEAAEMAAIARSLGAADDRMVLEERSRTTWENVAFTRELVTPGSLVVLVSDGVHAHRARRWWIRQAPGETSLVVADPGRRPFERLWITAPSALGQLLRPLILLAMSRGTAGGDVSAVHDRRRPHP